MLFPSIFIYIAHALFFNFSLVEKPSSKATCILSYTGLVMARRGDLIRCTLIGEENDGQCSFLFTMNGRKINVEKSDEKPFTLDTENGPLYPYIAMADGCSVLARVSIILNAVIGILKTNRVVPRMDTPKQGWAPHGSDVDEKRSPFIRQRTKRMELH